MDVLADVWTQILGLNDMSVDTEITSMASLAQALDGLDDEARGRVLRWAADRYKVAIGRRQSPDSEDRDVAVAELPDLPTLFNEVSPRTDAEKALVAAYWLQVVEGAKEWESQPLNTALKNLGHGVSNITDAVGSLIDRRPSLVIQVHKSGNTRQARKRHKLTAAGIAEVRTMLQRGPQQNEH